MSYPSYPPASHYNALQGAVENNTDPKPIQPEAIAARKRAIRDGRLVVVDKNDPATTKAVACAGCDAVWPVVEFATGDSNRMRRSHGSPTYTWAIPTGRRRPRLTATDQNGQQIGLEVSQIEVAQVSGACRREGENCVSRSPCRFTVSILFECGVRSPAGATVIPSLLITDPLTNETIEDALPPLSSRLGGTFAGCAYRWSGSTTLAAGLSLAVPFGFADLDVAPATGSWSGQQIVDGQDAGSVRLACGACVRGGAA